MTQEGGEDGGYLFTKEVGGIRDVVAHLALGGDADFILPDIGEVRLGLLYSSVFIHYCVYSLNSLCKDCDYSECVPLSSTGEGALLWWSNLLCTTKKTAPAHRFLCGSL